MSTNTYYPFSFGSFASFCSSVTLPICPLVGPEPNIVPYCYSRNIEISNALLFEPATLVIQVIALIMVLIMIFNVKSKYTAVGRKEIMFFFYLYGLTTIFEFLVLSGIIATATSIYPYFVATHTALIVATCWSLLFNGFVGFQWIEDGTALSLWTLRISSFVVWGVSFFIAIGTFQSQFGFNKESPLALWILYFGFTILCILLYIILQIILVVNTLEDWWPLIDLAFGTVFFATGQVIEFVLSGMICDLAKHYVDGMFFGTICSLLSVMMVYKYWDGITKEDLEFSVGGKLNNWEIRDPLLSNDSLSNFNKLGSSNGMPPQRSQSSSSDSR